MAATMHHEVAYLEQEYEWLLEHEVHDAIAQLTAILQDCSKHFPMALCGVESSIKQDKFVLNNQQSATDGIKCVVSVNGDLITQADISLRIHRHSLPVIHTQVTPEAPWKLQQVQDAGNHLQMAMQRLSDVDKEYRFQTGEEVSRMFSSVLDCLQRGRSSLIIPKKRTIEDLINSRNVKSLVPQLPGDVAISFYLQSHKLVLAVYHLTHSHGTTKFDAMQAECSVPWLNEVLVLFTIALQLCQRVKDKIQVFSQYKDFNPDSRSESACSHL
ncbi:unnamed protein product [Darwinula stevensoni]|uniref:Protein rogdi n=1 Tax=Darwinula stevensoni TaxID=69355 RepID=A0A7R9FQ44_9CRUS|nr:unnamed protein product [Darwinula stevensoni]CAG0898568.1 unnamed protein product [Darwinula stevensoni]